MAIYIKSGKRGRPLAIDVVKELENFDVSIAKVKNRLAQFREQTSGERREDIFGSETSLPKNILATYETLKALENGIYINYETAKELKANLRMIKRLSSSRERVFGKALAENITNQYIKNLEYAGRNSSKFVKDIYKKLGEQVKKLTPNQQQKFYMSRQYQNPKTNFKEYQVVIKWAENDKREKTGEEVELTGEEALAYVFQQKQEEFIKEL